MKINSDRSQSPKLKKKSIKVNSIKINYNK